MAATRPRSGAVCGAAAMMAPRLVEEAQQQGGGHLGIAGYGDPPPRPGRRPRPAAGRRRPHRGPGTPRSRAPPVRRRGSGPSWGRRRPPCRPGSPGAAGRARRGPRGRRRRHARPARPRVSATTAAATSVLDAKWWYSAPRVTPATLGDLLPARGGEALLGEELAAPPRSSAARVRADRAAWVSLGSRAVLRSGSTAAPLHHICPASQHIYMRAARMLPSPRPRRWRQWRARPTARPMEADVCVVGAGLAGLDRGPPAVPGGSIGRRPRGPGPGGRPGVDPDQPRRCPRRHGRLLRRPEPRAHARADQGDGGHHVPDLRARATTCWPPAARSGATGATSRASARSPCSARRQAIARMNAMAKKVPVERPVGRAQGGRVGRPLGAGLADGGARADPARPATSSRRRCGPASLPTSRRSRSSTGSSWSARPAASSR